MKFCPKCAAKNDDGAAVCRNAACGHSFDAAPGSTETSAPAKGTSGAGRRYCNKCGTGNAMGAAKCVRCGAALPDMKPDPPPPKPHPAPVPPSRRHRLADFAGSLSLPAKIAAALVVCAGLGIAVAVSHGGSRERHPSAAAGSPTDAFAADQPSQATMPQSMPSIFNAAPGHAFDSVVNGGTAWGIAPGTGSAFAMFAQDAEPSGQSGQRRGNRGSDIGSQALQIMQQHMKSAAPFTDSEMAILEQEIMERKCSDEQKRNSIALLRQSNAGSKVFAFYNGFTIQMAEAGIRRAEDDMRQLECDAKTSQIQDKMHEREINRMEIGFGVPQYVPKFGTGPTGTTITWDPEAAVRWNIPYVPFNMSTVPCY